MRGLTIIAILATGIAVSGCGSLGLDTTWFDGGARPRDARLSHYEQGKRSFESGQFGLALHQFELSLAREGETVAALNGIAAAYDRLNRFDVAERIYQRALALNPREPRTLNNLAFSNYLQGHHERAARYLRMAQAEATDDGEMIASNLRLVHAALGRRDHRVVANADRKLWIERAGVDAYTVVTDPPAEAIQLAAATSTDPRLFHVAAVYAAPRQPVAATPADPLPSPAVPPAPVRKHAIRAELSNGVGRNGLAARLRGVFAAKDYAFQRLTNDAVFGHARSVIFYRPEYRDEASRLAAFLPSGIRLQADPTLVSDIKLRIGRDLLYLDDELSI